MALPIQPVIEPSVLRGQTNGQLPASLLHAVKMPGGGPDALLVEPAARAMRAMVAHAARDGILLCSTSSYRPRADQDRLFRDRFRTYDTGRRPAVTRTYEGRTWWLRPGVALAAVPGTSNHGKGLADDLSEQLDSDPEPESISDRAVNWLIANAWTYGYSAEVQSEPWHWRYCKGDDIPAAVLLYESTMEEDVIFVRDTSASPPGIYQVTGIDPATGKGALVHLTSWGLWADHAAAFGWSWHDIKGIDPAKWVVVTATPAQAAAVDAAAVAKALIADPTFAKALADAAFVGAQRAERE